MTPSRISAPGEGDRTADILRRAKARIEDPKRWTWGKLARTAGGNSIGPCEANAVCWCAIGAVRAESPDDYVAEENLYDAAGDLFLLNPPNVNDELGHSAVMQMYDRAIELAEAQS